MYLKTRLRPVLIKANTEIKTIVKIGGVPDLKNCYHYFTGRFSQVLATDMGAQNDSYTICNARQGCQIFLAPNIPKREKYTK
jgi:hypothetical protein